MFYYAVLNASDIVEAVYQLPTQITHPSYISIPTNDQTLIGKRYNRATGEFVDVVLYYYAVLGNKDIVVEVISSEETITDPNKILIPTYNTALIGKWYNRATSQFQDPPIHILAEHTTEQINIVNQDKWLQTELDEIKANFQTELDETNASLQTGLAGVNTALQTGLAETKATLRAELAGVNATLQTQLNTTNTTLQTQLAGVNAKLTTLDRGSFGGYKCRFNMEDNQETTSEWSSGNGKHYTFSFDTGLSGYFPKMVRIVREYFSDATLIADCYIVKNPDGTVKRAYLDKTYIGIPNGSASTTPTRVIDYNIDMEDSNAITVGRKNTGKTYDEGGSAFFQDISTNNSGVDIGNFNYTENTFSFDMQISSNLVGNYTDIDLKGYVF